MYTKTCPQCLEEFSTNYEIDKWCGPACRAEFKKNERLAKWAKGKRGKPSPKNAFRLFGVDKPDHYGWG